jgi:hypothetical protein
VWGLSEQPILFASTSRAGGGITPVKEGGKTNNSANLVVVIRAPIGMHKAKKKKKKKKKKMGQR